MVPRLSLPFNWQFAKWFCLLHALHVWIHAGHIHGQLPAQVLPCWLLPQPLCALRQSCVSMFLLHFWVAAKQASFWVCFCWWYTDIQTPTMFEMLDILFWFHMAVMNASAWLMFCYKVLTNSDLASISTLLAIPQMNWSLMYMLDRSWSQLRHIKLQSHAPEQGSSGWTHCCFVQSMKMRSCGLWDLTSACQIVC